MVVRRNSCPVLKEQVAGNVSNLGQLVVRHQHQVVLDSLSRDPDIILLDSQLELTHWIGELPKPKPLGPLVTRGISFEQSRSD